MNEMTSTATFSRPFDGAQDEEREERQAADNRRPR